MAAERFVLLGLAHARSAWFRQVGQWANTAAVPCEFVKCVSATELRTRVDGDRPFSAALLDAGLRELDRDLVAAIRRTGCAVVAVADGRTTRDWRELGVDATLPFAFTRDELLEVLDRHARPLGRGDDVLAFVAPSPAANDDGRDDNEAGRRGRLVAVCGPGGTGASTAAIALAQGFAARGSAVVLADFCLHAEQAMLHDARDVAPGVQELVDAHRMGHARPVDVRALTFSVVERGYDLLLGLRRARFWSQLRPRAVEAGLESVLAAYDVVVVDVDADLEGEADAGSTDVEDRNSLARSAVAAADAVVVVGQPSMKGTHALVRVVREVVEAGVAPDRVVPVLSRAPRNPRARAELARTVAALAAPLALPSPVPVPDKRIDEMLRDGVRLPAPVVDPLVGAVRAVWARAGETRTTQASPLVDEAIPVLPGSLGVAT